ncbi:MAG: hypothetical protein HPY55_11855 [Firmicutes bacterium]|nr:hypothetical protein [Bacillota bacterium]
MRRGSLVVVLLLVTLLVSTGTALAAPSAAAGLCYGSSGKDVRELQRLLKSIGFDPGSADGVFGEDTERAVRSFQKASGLAVDGIVGPDTARGLADAEKRLTASPLAGKVIVLDPGHGGANPGATGVLGTREADHVLAIALELQRMLGEMGARVMMTRWSDTEAAPVATTRAQELSARAGMANSSRASVLVSIHSNAYEKDPSVSGVMAFHDGGGEDQRLAAALLAGLVAETGLRSVGLETAAFRVLKECQVPSALVEIGFMTNAHDEKLLNEESFRKQAARGILKGIVEFLGRS